MVTNYIPKNPRAIWKKDESMIAPWISLIRSCQTSVLSSYVMLAKTSLAGHFHSGKFKIANVGIKKETVVPWTMGSLTPKVHWRSVMRPETKMVVETKWLLDGSVSSMQSAGVRMKGTETVAQNMERKCFKKFKLFKYFYYYWHVVRVICMGWIGRKSRKLKGKL